MKIIIKSILIFSLSIVYSYSACDFKAKLGTKKTVFEKLEITGPPLPSEYENFYIYGVLAEDVCPSENLEDVAIEYKFINDELIAINLIALNDYTNQVSEKLTLMNYVKRNYGDFDTSNNPKSYIGFEVIEKVNEFIIYQRLLNDDATIDEQVYISNPEQDNKFMEYVKNLEEQQLKEEQ
ncbi:hypothetical protein N9U90_03365 [Candidatus Pelagibacter sp.]|jgi:hypothetical protein|nr:hypothetical protein [Candidatus Pelagibacter sp.]|tara:strand:+ start:385 stop:924 length:540 start_codon:yes stop_codon:yes gene_type:complete